MKNYTITVNGVAYAVTVEETGAQGAAPVISSVAPVAAPAPAPVPAAAPAPAPAPTPTPAPAPAAAGEGAHKLEAGAAGKVFKIEGKVGQSVNKGDTVVILEAMKMEIPMVAPVDGTIASIDCNVGDPVEAGDILATIN